MSRIKLITPILFFFITTNLVGGNLNPRNLPDNETIVKIRSGNNQRYIKKYIPGLSSKTRWSNTTSLSKPVTKPATNVTTEGYTANWQAVEGAEGYKVISILTHKAIKEESFILTNENFEGVDLGTVENPFIIKNIEEQLDDYANMPGWSLLGGAYAKGMVGLSNAYADLGMPSMLFSPYLNLSYDKGKFSVDLTVIPNGTSEIGVGLFYEDIENCLEYEMRPLNKKETLHFEFTKGVSKCFVGIYSSNDGILLIDDIKISQNLKADESVTLDHSSSKTQNTFCNIKTLGKVVNDEYSFIVGVWAGSEDNIVFSNPQTVNYSSNIKEFRTDNINIYYLDGYLNIDCDRPASIQVYSSAGICLTTIHSEGGKNKIPLTQKGLYMIHVNNHIYKIIN